MSNIGKRLLTFFIGLPIILGLVFLNFQHHLVLNIIITIGCVIGSYEFCSIVSSKIKLTSKVLVMTFAGLLPLLGYIFILSDISLEILLWVFTLEILFIMAVECFTAKEFSVSLEKISFSILALFYCSYMPTFITRLCYYENSVPLLILYFVFVFMCDSGAWFFGILFGKNNRGIFKASPNKSIAGFVGGIITDIALAVVIRAIFPDFFHGEYWRIIILAFITAVAAIIGDLVESVFKRSCGAKDSGKLIPGRGGLLDCMDSLIAAIPVYYIGLHFLYSL